MALCGVSVSDLKNYGFNTAVGAGVLVGCAAVAWGVKKLALKGFSAVTPKDITLDSADNHTRYSQLLGLAAGLGTAAAAYKFVPGSRFALISDDSNSKMFKFGVVQAISGLVIDGCLEAKFMTASVIGLGGALVTRVGYLALAGLGVYGAILGTRK